MRFSKEDVLQYVQEEDVKFIRLAFCDVFGKQKNISILKDELPRAFKTGIAIDGSAIRGFGDETHSDLILHPDPETLMVLPWRPEHGRVVLMYTSITWPDGSPFTQDTRSLLKNAIREAEEAGYHFAFGAELEFYLFYLNEDGDRTYKPYDSASYMDIAPEDRGENVRREICLTLEQMDIFPESSHHEDGPGQNEIDFRFSEALTAADNAKTFQNVVATVARRYGLYADFSAKPLKDAAGNGFHINISVNNNDSQEDFEHMIAGILEHVHDMTLFLNPTKNSYDRFGSDKAPKYISWSHENRSQLIRIPAASGQYQRCELRSPDPSANPYLAYTLMIYAALDGITRKLPLQEAADFNLFRADSSTLKNFKTLPLSYGEACEAAKGSDFIKAHIPEAILDIYCR